MNTKEPGQERFVSEELSPVPDALDLSQSSPGEPAIPRQFRWRRATVEIRQVLRKWTSTSGCRHGSGEQYVRRHWYEIVTTDDRHMTLYFDRQARSSRERKKRWWVYSAE